MASDSTEWRKARRPDIERAIYDAIRRAIFEHRLLPGTHLPEETLAAIFGVNRQRIRRVLLRLAHDKIVELRPNRGACVAQPTPKEAEELFSLRKLLEGFAVRQLVGRLTAEELAALEQHLAAERAAFERGDRHALIRLSGAFHLELARLTGNRVLEELLQGLVARSSLLLALYGGESEELCSHEEHRRIIEALRSSDPRRAEEALTAHLDAIAARLHLREPVDATENLRAIFRDVLAETLPHS